MDTITVNGKLYTKASVLAKQFRYTTDYIGQLCRAKKVDCQFVGRTWYVTESSLLVHKDARYKEVRLDEKTIKNSTHLSVSSSEVAVRPRLLKTATKAKTTAHFADRLIPRESKYFSDETELLPVPAKSSDQATPLKPKIIPVIPEDARPIPVSGEKKPLKLGFTDLPSVVLNGRLEVVEIVPDETPSRPVVITDAKPAETVSSRVLAKEPAKAVLKPEIPINEPAIVSHAKIVYTPEQVRQAAGSKSGRRLVVLAVLMSVSFFGFVTTTADEFVIGKNYTAKRVTFEPNQLVTFFRELQ